VRKGTERESGSERYGGKGKGGAPQTKIYHYRLSKNTTLQEVLCQDFYFRIVFNVELCPHVISIIRLGIEVFYFEKTGHNYRITLFSQKDF